MTFKDVFIDFTPEEWECPEVLPEGDLKGAPPWLLALADRILLEGLLSCFRFPAANTT